MVKLNINDRAALAIKNNSKRVELRCNKDNFDKIFTDLIKNNKLGN